MKKTIELLNEVVAMGFSRERALSAEKNFLEEITQDTAQRNESSYRL